MREKLKPIALMVGLYLLFASGNGEPWTWPIGGGAPSFSATKLTVLVVEDDSPAAREALVGEQDDIMRSLLPDGVRKSVEAAGGEFRVIGKANSVAMDSANVQAAFAVADKVNVPSIVASTPKAGIKPQRLPTTIADTKKLLAPLGVK